MYYNAVETGKRIQILRKEKGLTQKELADSLNISLGYLQKLESGHRDGSVESLTAISLFFQVSLDYLILGKSRNEEMQMRLREIADCLEKIADIL